MKRIIFFIAIFSVVLMSCNRTDTESKYVKKVELNEETIAVGIYKATGYDYPNIKYIAEAINIDAGIVYVTLTDADVLKTKLENIDVIIFPGMKSGQYIDQLDDEIAQILRNFITQKGKGAIGVCSGCGILSNSNNSQSLGLVKLDFDKSNAELSSGLLNFKLTENGKNIFPDLQDYENLLIHVSSDFSFNLLDTAGVEIVASNLEGNIPLVVTTKSGNGKIAMLNVNAETTPGMRWMIPRMVRWSTNKEYVWYDKNIFRPELFNEQVIIDDELNTKLKELISKLDSGKKDDIIDAMDELEQIYPWAAAEKVRSLLIEKNGDIKLRAAKYLVNIEYTVAVEDMKKIIKNERSRKTKEKLYAYQVELENMMDQN